MTIQGPGDVNQPDAVELPGPGGPTALTFTARDDEGSSTIDVEYRITMPPNIRFANGSITERLTKFPIDENPSPVRKVVSFRTIDGKPPDAIDVQATVSGNGGGFPVPWTVPIKYTHLAMIPIEGMMGPTGSESAGTGAAASDAAGQALSLVRQLCALLPALEAQLGASPGHLPVERAANPESGSQPESDKESSEKKRANRTRDKRKPSGGR